MHKKLWLLIGLLVAQSVFAAKYVVVNRSDFAIRLYFNVIGGPSVQTAWIEADKISIVDMRDYEVYSVKVRSNGWIGTAYKQYNFEVDKNYGIGVYQDEFGYLLLNIRVI